MNRFDVVVVAFPFTDRDVSKRRPALVVSKESFNSSAGNVLLAMITSSGRDKWPGDVSIHDLHAAGLHTKSLVRFKVFTLDERLVVDTIGHLAKVDRDAFERAQRKVF